nr:MAG TPA: hypothetical protein [Caudoviricetes sp.]
MSTMQMTLNLLHSANKRIEMIVGSVYHLH